MAIYRTRFGVTYRLDEWPEDHVKWIQQAHLWYSHGMPYEQFVQRILGPSSPVLDKRRNGPKPTRTPLYEVATDLQFRLGVRQGLFQQDWEGEVDPEWPDLRAE